MNPKRFARKESEMKFIVDEGASDGHIPAVERERVFAVMSGAVNVLGEAASLVKVVKATFSFLPGSSPMIKLSAAFEGAGDGPMVSVGALALLRQGTLPKCLDEEAQQLANDICRGLQGRLAEFRREAEKIERALVAKFRREAEKIERASASKL